MTPLDDPHTLRLLLADALETLTDVFVLLNERGDMYGAATEAQQGYKRISAALEQAATTD